MHCHKFKDRQKVSLHISATALRRRRREFCLVVRQLLLGTRVTKPSFVMSTLLRCICVVFSLYATMMKRHRFVLAVANELDIRADYMKRMYTLWCVDCVGRLLRICYASRVFYAHAAFAVIVDLMGMAKWFSYADRKGLRAWNWIRVGLRVYISCLCVWVGMSKKDAASTEGISKGFLYLQTNIIWLIARVITYINTIRTDGDIWRKVFYVLVDFWCYWSSIWLAGWISHSTWHLT